MTRDPTNRRHQRTLDSCTSVVTQIVPTYEYSQRFRCAEQRTGFVHVVDILLQDIGRSQLFAYNVEPFLRLVVDVMIMSLLIYCLHTPSLQLRMTPEEGQRPVPSRAANRRTRVRAI